MRKITVGKIVINPHFGSGDASLGMYLDTVELFGVNGGTMSLSLSPEAVEKIIDIVEHEIHSAAANIRGKAA